MENKPNFSPQFGAPPPRSNAISRFMGYVRAFALPAVVIGGVLIFGAENLFMPEYRPSHMIGIFLGNIEKAEIGAKQEASTEYANRMTEAQAKAQANAQIEAEIARQQQEAVRESLSGQSTMAVISDWACAIGSLIPPNAADDWRTFGGALRSRCGASARIRDTMVQEQARAGRNGTAIEPREVAPAPVHRDPDTDTQAATPRFRPYTQPYALQQIP
jgi:hypothetical protein